MRLKRIQKLDSHRPLRRGRFIFCLSCSLALLGMIAPELPKNDPPHPPLQRGDARIYNIQIQVQNKLRTTGWPMLPHTNWSQLDVDSVGVSDATSKDIPLPLKRLQQTQNSGNFKSNRKITQFIFVL